MTLKKPLTLNNLSIFFLNKHSVFVFLKCSTVFSHLLKHWLVYSKNSFHTIFHLRSCTNQPQPNLIYENLNYVGTVHIEHL